MTQIRLLLRKPQKIDLSKKAVSVKCGFICSRVFKANGFKFEWSRHCFAFLLFKMMCIYIK